MKQSIKLLLGGALLLSLPMFLTSCEDILGEWSKPTPSIVTPSDGGGATTSDTYIKYSTSGTPSNEPIGNATKWEFTATTTVPAGTYYVEGSVHCAGKLILAGEVNLILKDGATLTVDDGITAYDDVFTNLGGSLNIYAQSTGDSKGKLVVTNNTPVGGEAHAVIVNTITIHGGDINVTADTNPTPCGVGAGLETIKGNLIIYDGKITAEAPGSGFMVNEGDLNIWKGTITSTSTNNGGIQVKHTTTGGNILIKDGTITATSGAWMAGITASGDMEIDGGTVTANGAKRMEGIAVTSGTLTIKGGTVNANGGEGDIDSNPVGGQGIMATTVDVQGGSLTAIGGNGANGAGAQHAGGDGGPGISGNVKVSGSATVIATGGKGGDGKNNDNDGDGGNGGIGIDGDLDNASPNVTVTGGNGGNAGYPTSGSNTGGTGAAAISGTLSGSAAPIMTNGNNGNDAAVL